MRVAVVVVMAACAAVSVPATGAAIPVEPTDGYIVTLDGTADPPAVAAEHARLGGVRMGYVYQYALRGYSAQLTPVAAARIAKDPRVLSVQPDGTVGIATQPGPARPMSSG